MNYIVDDIGVVVEAMREDWSSVDTSSVSGESGIVTANGYKAPYYMYDSRLKIARGLLEKSKDMTLKFQKYPLIALRLPVDQQVVNGVINYRLNIGIFSYTRKEYNTQQRYNNVFKPILFPLYKMFFEKLKESGLFMWPGFQELPDHRPVERPLWGTEGAEKNEKYIFDDPLDCIELIDLRVNSRIKNC